MMELQGAIGIAQLNKLDFVVQSQRDNMSKIKDKISMLNIDFRTVPKKSFETADALVFFVESNQIALKCREVLINNGIGTKILPEAITWHFAGSWDHMPSLVENLSCDIKQAFSRSRSFLDRSVALPISVKMEDSIPQKIFNSLSKIKELHS